MSDLDIVVLFTAFDMKIGQVPLFVRGNIDDRTALKVSNHVAITILATADPEIDHSTFHGESIVPLIDESLIAVVYFFYIANPSLVEPVFSSILYCVPMEERDIIYTNIGQLTHRLAELATLIKKEFGPNAQHPIHELTLDKPIEDSLSGLYQPLKTLLGPNFLDHQLGEMGQTKLIQSQAVVTFDNSPMGIDVVFVDQMDKKQVSNISYRLITGILSHLKEEDSKLGEAILPVLDSDLITFCYFFRAKGKIGILIFFINAKHRLDIYKWAPIYSQHCYQITEPLKDVDITTRIPNKTKRQLKGFYYLDIKTPIGKTKDEGKEEKVEPAKLVKFKNFDRVIHALLIGNPVIITGVTIDEAKDVTAFLNTMTPHRDLDLLTTTDILSGEPRPGIYFISKDQIPKKINKTIAVVELDKKKVQAELTTQYAKNLQKKIKKLQIAEIQGFMTQEVLSLLNLVDEMVITAQTTDQDQAKAEIDTLIKNLPDTAMFDTVKELAIKYNPILADLIAKKAIYTVQTELWGR